jgi:aminopeptidase N
VRLQAVSTGATKELLLGRNGEPVTTEIDGCGPVIVNAGQAGYFRTRYAAPELAALASEFPAVAEIDRLGVLNDTWALGEAGELPVTSYLELAEAVSIDSDPLILMQLARTFTNIDKLFDGVGGQAAWRAFARERLKPVLERVGSLPAPTEAETTGRLREELIRALGRFDDPAVLAEARRRFARAATDPDALPPAIREATIEVVARHADANTWNELLARARAASEPIEKERLFAALGRGADRALVTRALALSLSGEVPTAFASTVIAIAAAEHPKLVFDYAVANEEAVLDVVESSSRWAFIPDLAQTSGDAVMATQVRDYADRSIPKGSRQSAERVIADITFRARVKTRQLPALEAWVGNRVANAGGR